MGIHDRDTKKSYRSAITIHHELSALAGARLGVKPAEDTLVGRGAGSSVSGPQPDSMQAAAVNLAPCKTVQSRATELTEEELLEHNLYGGN